MADRWVGISSALWERHSWNPRPALPTCCLCLESLRPATICLPSTWPPPADSLPSSRKASWPCSAHWLPPQAGLRGCPALLQFHTNFLLALLGLWPQGCIFHRRDLSGPWLTFFSAPTSCGAGHILGVRWYHWLSEQWVKHQLPPLHPSLKEPMDMPSVDNSLNVWDTDEVHF